MFIYKITNKINGKSYIGQTIRSVEKRWRQHQNKINNCVGLRGAIKKYGPDAFDVELIQKCFSLEEMNNRERFYIVHFNTLSPNGYNLNGGGNGKIISEETRKRASAARTGKMTKEKNHWYKIGPPCGKMNRVPVICLTTGEKFTSLTEASKKFNLLTSKISKVCQLQCSHTKGFVFRYVGEENLVFVRKKRTLRKPHNPKTKKPVQLVELDLTFQKISEAVKYCVDNKRPTNRAAIRRACQGIYKSAAGYTWRFL